MIRESSLMAPYIKHPTTTRGIMLDVMLCMAALYLIAAFYYGWRAVMLGVVSMAVCMLCEWLGSILRLERHNAHDISALVTGMMIPLMLPASIPYYVVIVADVFAILLVKYAFGGTGYNLFNPAAGGLLFVTLCWPQLVFAYPATFTNPEVFGEVTARTTNSIAYVLSVGSVPSTDMTSVMLGLHPGPMGTLNGLVLWPVCCTWRLGGASGCGSRSSPWGWWRSLRPSSPALPILHWPPCTMRFLAPRRCSALFSCSRSR